MQWRSFSDPSYVPDHSSEFLRNPALRRRVLFFDILRSVICFGLVLTLSFILLVLGAATQANIWLLGGIIFVIVGGLGYVVSKSSWLRKVPVKCSKCLNYMERTSQKRSEIFYICPECKRYIDTGFSEED